MVRFDSAVSNHIASFRLDPCPLNRGERRGGTESGNQGRTLQRPPPFEGPVLRAVLSKIKISRDLTKEALFLKGTINVGSASHYSPINPQAVSNLSRKS